MDAYGFWVKVFALTFALGVVSGVTMSFQFGTNWPGYMETVGNIAGPLLAYEVLTAFFLEATFLGVMLFGRERVATACTPSRPCWSPCGTTLVGVLDPGAQFLDADAGRLRNDRRPGACHRLVGGDLQSVVPVSLAAHADRLRPDRAFLVAGLSAYRWLRGDRAPAVLAALRTGVFVAAVLIPVQIFVGDLHGLNTLEHQPAKVAAMEGIWETERGAPLLLFALPNENDAQQRLRDRAFPKLAQPDPDPRPRRRSARPQ